MRWALFTVYVADEDFLRAASILSGARLESDCLSDEEKVRVRLCVLPFVLFYGVYSVLQAKGCVKAALYFLRAEDDVGADRMLKKDMDAVHRCGDLALSLLVG